MEETTVSRLDTIWKDPKGVFFSRDFWAVMMFCRDHEFYEGGRWDSKGPTFIRNTEKLEMRIKEDEHGTFVVNL